MTFSVLKNDVLIVFRPADDPSSFLHPNYKIILGRTFRYCLHDSRSAVDYIAFLLLIGEKTVLVLVPSMNLSGLDVRSVEVLSLFSYGQPSATTEFICEVLLPLKIVLCLMQFLSVHEGNRICHYVNMEMIPVLVDCNQILVVGEELLAELSANLQAFCGIGFLVLMEADHIVSKHPSTVFSPELFFFQECIVNTIHRNHFR